MVEGWRHTQEMESTSDSTRAVRYGAGSVLFEVDSQEEMQRAGLGKWHDYGPGPGADGPSCALLIVLLCVGQRRMRAAKVEGGEARDEIERRATVVWF